MCVAPNLVSEIGPVACRKCWQCKADRVNDYVGRCIAEKAVSDRTLALTLTYAGDTVNSAVLIYSDFQIFLRKLRDAGYSVRYIVAGEYGSRKGRAHWHCVLFFKGKIPDLPEKERVDWEFWPHGFTWSDECSYRSMRYLLKYALKGASGEISKNEVRMSKRPPLGDAFFRELASKYARTGVPVTGKVYTLPGEVDSLGKPRKFLMSRHTWWNFQKYYQAACEALGRPMAYSDVEEELTDRQAVVDEAKAQEEWYEGYCEPFRPNKRQIKYYRPRWWGPYGLHENRQGDLYLHMTDEKEQIIWQKNVEKARDVQRLMLLDPSPVRVRLAGCTSLRKLLNDCEKPGVTLSRSFRRSYRDLTLS